MGKLNITELPLSGAYFMTPNNHTDERGSFSRVFCRKEMSEIFDESFAQVNHSITLRKGTVRGMHFQYPPNAEVKMVKCIKGSVFDVIVDIRKGSPTFLQWHGEVLSAENMKMLYIPKGFAHGFQTLEENSELFYFHSEFYTPGSEGSINVKEPRLNIQWPLKMTNISAKDEKAEYIDNSFQGITYEV